MILEHFWRCDIILNWHHEAQWRLKVCLHQRHVGLAVSAPKAAGPVRSTYPVFSAGPSNIKANIFFKDYYKPKFNNQLSPKLSNGYVLPEGKVTPNAIFVGGIDMKVRMWRVQIALARFGWSLKLKVHLCQNNPKRCDVFRAQKVQIKQDHIHSTTHMF